MSLSADVLTFATLDAVTGEVSLYPCHRAGAVAEAVLVGIAKSPTLVDASLQLNGACVQDLLHRAAVELESRTQPAHPPASGSLGAGIATTKKVGRLTFREPQWASAIRGAGVIWLLATSSIRFVGQTRPVSFRLIS
jgi:hypothetical protein